MGGIRHMNACLHVLCMLWIGDVLVTFLYAGNLPPTTHHVSQEMSTFARMAASLFHRTLFSTLKHRQTNGRMNRNDSYFPVYPESQEENFGGELQKHPKKQASKNSQNLTSAGKTNWAICNSKLRGRNLEEKSFGSIPNTHGGGGALCCPTLQGLSLHTLQLRRNILNNLMLGNYVPLVFLEPKEQTASFACKLMTDKLLENK